jgi:hypothetical protein
MPEATDSLACACGHVHPDNPDVAEPEEQEEPEPTCETCGEPESECECVDCLTRHCRWRGPAEDRCAHCERCESCCECWTCEACGRRRDSDDWQCDHCNCCERCCECCSCENCNWRGDADGCCSECNCCERCCECSGENSGVSRFDAPAEPKHHVASRKEHKRNPSKRLIAAEIEVSKLRDASEGHWVESAVRKWAGAIVEDGSLPDTGFEINTAPASGDRFCAQVEEICAALAEAEAEADRRCGLHVHVDARDFTYWDIRRLILLYAKVEDALFAIVPPSRRTSSYCERCSARYLTRLADPKDTRSKIVQNIYKGDPDTRNHRKSKYDHARYAALNLHSWFYRGTVECRLAAGTVSADKIVNWGLLWAGILDTAARLSEAQINALKGDSLEILLSLAPTPGVLEWVKERHAKFNPERKVS